MDRAALRAALEAADIVPLALALVHLGGDASLLDRVRPHVEGPWDFSQHVPPDLAAEIRARLAHELSQAPSPAHPMPDEATLVKMMSTAVGETVSGEYVPMMLEELSLDGRDRRQAAWRAKPAAPVLDAFRVAVIGAGMSGLAAAIRLREAGIPFTVLEKNDALGGTWYENRYPGCGVDSPNHFYSYSFEPNHEWSEFFSKRDELWSYFERCADRHDLRRDIRLRTEVLGAQWDEAAARWRLRLRNADGAEETLAASALISAVGQLNRPFVPQLPGIGDFAGPAFHTARWDPDVALGGRRVAIIGTGASAMQAAPALADAVSRLTIFQRTPHWAVPNPNYHRRVSAQKKWVLEHVPFYARWYRFQLFWAFGDGIHPALQIEPGWHDPQRSLNAANERFRRAMTRHLRRELEGDEELIAKVTPSYPPYGKRMLIDNHWYRMLRRPNVSLVTDSIRRVTRDAIETADGARHRADAIVFATGFEAARMLAPMELRGRGGVPLRELWGDDDPRAYLGITVPGFPNFFVLYGPNTNLGHGGSIIFHTECQVRYVMLCLREMLERGWRSLECRGEVHDAYNARVDAAHRRMVWSHPGMGNWYRNASGRVTQNSPWRLVDYWRMTREPDFADYRTR